MKTIIKNLKEYNRNLYNNPRDASINTLDGIYINRSIISLANKRKRK